MLPSTRGIAIDWIVYGLLIARWVARFLGREARASRPLRFIACQGGSNYVCDNRGLFVDISLSTKLSRTTPQCLIDIPQRGNEFDYVV